MTNDGFRSENRSLTRPFCTPGNFCFGPEFFASHALKNPANAGKKLVAHPLLGKF
jgi:hypothetical protein